MWQLRLLGTCELRSAAGAAVQFSTRKALGLLIFLARQPEQRASRQRLATLLWEDATPEQARQHIRKALWLIRTETAAADPAAPALLSTEGDAILFTPGALTTDVEAFEQAAASDDPAALDRAAALYTGEFLEDFTIRNAPGFEEWAAAERQRLREIALSGLGSLMDRALAPGGSSETGIRAAMRVLALDPLQERAHRALMRLHVRQGRHAAALKQFHALSETLRRDLDVLPELATQELFREITIARRAVEAPARPSLVDAEIALVSRPEDSGAGLAEELTTDASAAPVDATAVAAAPMPGGARRRIAPLAAGLGALAIAGVLVWPDMRAVGAATSLPPVIERVFPVVTDPPINASPALSPDGSRLVFSSRQPASGNIDLYFSSIGGQPMQLTRDPAVDTGAIWSPDGTEVAFVRTSGGDNPCRIFAMTVPDGRERLIGRCRTVADTRLAWTPDGRSLIFNDRAVPGGVMQLFSLDLQTGQPRALTTPPATTLGDHQGVVSRDGRSVAFLRSATWRAADIFSLDLATGDVRRLTQHGGIISGLAWSSNDGGVLYSSDHGGDTGLWWVPARGGAPQRVSEGLLQYRWMSHARDRDRLIFEAMRDRTSFYELTPAAGTHPRPIERLQADSVDLFPDVARDGATVFVSVRSGAEQLWLAPPTGAAVQLTRLEGWHFLEPHWSPDGRHIAFIGVRGGQADLYTIARDGGAPIRLTDDAGEDGMPSWSPDGQFLYYVSRKSGQGRVWRLSPFSPRPAPQAVTGDGIGAARVAPDGRWLYYMQDGKPGLWRQPLTADGAHIAGHPALILADLDPFDWMNWFATDSSIYYARRSSGSARGTIRRYDLVRREGQDLANASDLHRASSFALRPDGSLILTVRKAEVDLMGIDFAKR